MPKESLEKKKTRFKEVIRLLNKYYPDAHCALDHETPDQLLFATILSAQCTDERVNMVTPNLFEKYPQTKDLATAQLKDVEDIVRSTGFFRNKAKNLIAAAKDIVEEHHGKLPRTLKEMTELAGVGRKTANVVLGNAFGIASGIVVDTHVKRLSNRLGFVNSQNPEIIERQLNEMIDKKYWVMLPHWLITHGRQVCKARKPSCHICFLDEQCPKRGV